MIKKPKVCIIGAESWGSALATAVCENVLKGNFDSRVHIYVYDEFVRSKYLSELMNERHENIKYLPGIELSSNLIAVNDLLEAAQEADILIFATPHNFVKPYCNILEGNVKSTAYAVSLIKGLDHIRDGEIDLYSHTISNQLHIPCYSLMCANSAMEMAQGKLCEMTIGCDNEEHARQLTTLFQTENCKVYSIDDVDGVELCYTLKDLVALGAGFIDGLRLGDNARVACLHLGLKEMMRFIMTFDSTTKLSTLFESCGVANSLACSYAADKNVTFAKNFVTTRKTVQEIESTLLNGRKLLGPIVAEEIFAFLGKHNMQAEYPLFTVIHRICRNEVEPDAIVDTLRNHPDLRNYSITKIENEENMLPSSYPKSVSENVADTVPEYISLENIVRERSNDKIADGFKEEEGIHEPYYPYFNTTDVPLNKFERSGLRAVAELDDSKPDSGSVEFAFELESESDKPDVLLRLKETIPSTPDLSMDSPFRHGLAGNNFLSIKGQPVVMSQSGRNNSGDEKSTSVAGLTQLIERHVKPLNDKYKALKVRVKSKTEGKKSEEQNKTEKSNKQEEQPQNLYVRKADSKPRPIDIVNESEHPSTFNKMAENSENARTKLPNSEIANKSSDGVQVLYEKESTFGMRMFDDEPNVTKLLDTIRDKEHEALEREMMFNAVNDNEKAKKTFTQEDKMLERTNEDSKNINRKQSYQNQHPNVAKTLNTLRSKEKEALEREMMFKAVNHNEKPKKTFTQEEKMLERTNEDFNNRNRQHSHQKPQPEMEKANEIKKKIMDTKKAIENDKQGYKVDYLKSIRQKYASNNLDSVPLQYSKTDNSYRPTKNDLTALDFWQNNYRLTGYEQSKLDQPQIKDAMASFKSIAIEPTASAAKTPDEHSKKTLHNVTHKKDDRAIDDTTEEVLQWAVREASKDKRSATLDQSKPCPDFDDYNEQRISLLKKQEAYLRNLVMDCTAGESTIKQVNDDSAKMLQNDPREIQELDGEQKADDVAKWTKHCFDKNQHISELGETANIAEMIDGTEAKRSEDQKLLDDQRSVSSAKKKSHIGNEDPNLRHYHGKNDGEKGPEWDWLLVADENLKERQKALYKRNLKESQNSDTIEPDVQPQAKLEHRKEKTISEPQSSSAKESSRKTSSKSRESLKESKNAKRNITNDLRVTSKKTDERSTTELPQETISEQNDEKIKPARESMQQEAPELKAVQRNEEISQQEISSRQWDDSLQESNDDATQDKRKAYTEEEVPYKIKLNREEGKLSHREESVAENDPELNDESTVNKREELPDEDNQYKMILKREGKFNPIESSLDQTPDVSRIKPKLKKLHDYEERVNYGKESRGEESHGKRRKSQSQEDVSHRLNLKRAQKKISKLSKILTKRMTKKQSGKLSDPRDERVDYRGQDPYIRNRTILPQKSFEQTFMDVEEADSKRHRQKKKIVIKPAFHPPINPRVRIPRPPFDVRDHEYHTVTYCAPPDLLRHASLPQRKLPVAYKAKHVAAASNVAKLPRPGLKLPAGAMRSSVLAVELGIFAALLTRYGGGPK